MRTYRERHDISGQDSAPDSIPLGSRDYQLLQAIGGGDQDVAHDLLHIVGMTVCCKWILVSLSMSATASAAAGSACSGS